MQVSESPEDGPLASPPAFPEIFREYAPFLWRTLLGLGVPAADAEDLCQEVMVIVHRKLSTFRGSAIKSWIYGICLRVASDYRRSARVRRERPTDALPEQTVFPNLAEDLDARRAEVRLIAALDDLDDDRRAVFVLYEVEQLTLKEISEAMKCPLQTVYSRLKAARAHVRAAMSPEGDDRERA